MQHLKINATIGIRKTILWVAVIAALTSGCGSDSDGGTDATDFDGFWLLNSMTMDAGSGPTTVTRGGMPIGLIGDAVFASSDADSGTLDIRFATIDNQMMEDEPTEFLGSITVESDRWVILSPNDPMDPNDDTTTVFTSYLDGEELTLTADRTDPRNDTDDGPDEIIMTRRAPWDSELTGTWNYTLLNGTDPTGCIAISPTTSTNSTPSLTVTPRWWTEFETYANFWDSVNDCSGSPTDVIPGVVNGTQWITEIENGTLRAYGYVDTTMQGHYEEWTFVASGPNYDFTKVECQPMDTCTHGATTFTVSPTAP